MNDPLTWLLTGGGLAVGLLGVICTAVIPLVIVGGLVVFLVRRSRQSGEARQAAQVWPSAAGTVLMSTIQIRRSGRHSRSEVPVVVYQYHVNGQMYQGNRIRAGDQFLTVRVAGQAQATLARYPAGAPVTVYYNPVNPAESALER